MLLYVVVLHVIYPYIGVHTDGEGGALFLPFAISTVDLLRKVKEALEEDHHEGLEEAGIKIPSCAWLEFQFAPINLGYKAALKHTGKLQVKHKVQVRTLRQTHVDSHYCAALFKYVKGMCLELAVAIRAANPTSVVRFASMDDKAKVFACQHILLLSCSIDPCHSCRLMLGSQLVLFLLEVVGGRASYLWT